MFERCCRKRQKKPPHGEQHERARPFRSDSGMCSPTRFHRRVSSLSPNQSGLAVIPWKAEEGLDGKGFIVASVGWWGGFASGCNETSNDVINRLRGFSGTLYHSISKSFVMSISVLMTLLSCNGKWRWKSSVWVTTLLFFCCIRAPAKCSSRHQYERSQDYEDQPCKWKALNNQSVIFITLLSLYIQISFVWITNMYFVLQLARSLSWQFCLLIGNKALKSSNQHYISATNWILNTCIVIRHSYDTRQHFIDTW